MLEVLELETGETIIGHPDGRFFDMAVIEMMFELHKQNPEFYEHWMELAKNYVLVGPAMVEA